MDQKLRELYPRVSDSILVVSCLSVFIVLFRKRELERARGVGPGANGMMGREGERESLAATRARSRYNSALEFLKFFKKRIVLILLQWRSF